MTNGENFWKKSDSTRSICTQDIVNIVNSDRNDCRKNHPMAKRKTVQNCRTLFAMTILAALAISVSSGQMSCTKEPITDQNQEYFLRAGCHSGFESLNIWAGGDTWKWHAIGYLRVLFALFKTN
jgi:hypothetical protein